MGVWGSPSPAAAATDIDRDELKEYGAHCALSTCNQLDFLPFKCPSCNESYCADHWRPGQGHDCSTYDASKHDVRSPVCPLCQAVVPLAFPAQDPNIPMDQHLASDCKAFRQLTAGLEPSSGETTKTSKPVKDDKTCSFGKCTKRFVGFDGIKCDGCEKKYCISHRSMREHKCSSLKPSPNSSRGASPAQSGSSGNLGSNVTGRGREVSLAGLAAIRRAAAATGQSVNNVNKPKAVTSPVSSSSPPVRVHAMGTPDSSKPSLSRTEKKHVKEEERSALMALERRAQLGVLSEEEKLRYATLKAEQQKKFGNSLKRGHSLKKDGDKTKGDCLIS